MLKKKEKKKLNKIQETKFTIRKLVFGPKNY